MGGDVICDAKVSSSDYLYASMKIGDWYCMDDYKDMKFDAYDKDYLNCGLKDDVSVMLPSDPFEMDIIGDGCTIEIKIDDTNGLILFDGKSKKVLHSVNNDHDNNVNCCNGDGEGGDVGVPHDALFYALGYLETRDLLSVERVCRLLRDGVRNDPLLWRNIHIDKPPSEFFGDDSLLKITSRANGSLQSLSLVKCMKITDIGLKNVFKTNPRLRKLSVLECNGLSMEGLLNNLKSFKSSYGGGIKRLRIGGIHSITLDHFEELKKILSINQQQQQKSPKPRLYHDGYLYLSLDDDRPIDIEPCPKCHYLRQVYDCPAESCKGHCRACTFCIPRCINCGCCFNERRYMETFCLDFLCLECLTQILSFPDGRRRRKCII